MTGDRRPQTGRSLGTSSAELEAQRRAWGDAGRQVWDAATRTGQNVLARTRSELEALGRAHLEAEAIRREEDSRATRMAAGSARAAVQIVRPGTPADPGPGRLLAEFATGRGPERRTLEPSSALSQEYVRAPSVQGHIKRAVADWQKRDGGMARYTNYDADFGLKQLFGDLEAGNGASNVIGSARLDAERHGDRINWSAANKMGRNSGLYGNPLSKYGLPGVPDTPRPGLFGSTRQVIRFATDLKGNPIRAPSGAR